MESLEDGENADEGAEATQETLNSSGTAGKVVDSDKAAKRDLFLNVVEGEL